MRATGEANEAAGRAWYGLARVQCREFPLVLDKIRGDRIHKKRIKHKRIQLSYFHSN